MLLKYPREFSANKLQHVEPSLLLDGVGDISVTGAAVAEFIYPLHELAGWPQQQEDSSPQLGRKLVNLIYTGLSLQMHAEMLQRCSGGDLKYSLCRCHLVG